MGKAARRKELRPQPEALFIQQPVTHSIQKVEQSVQIRSGPLPDPEAIAAYERALPGAADRIFRMAEKEQEHRHLSDLNESQRRHATIILGQAFAFTLGVFGVCGGIWLVANDKPLTGFTVFFTSLGTLIGIFFVRHKAQHKVVPKSSTS